MRVFGVFRVGMGIAYVRVRRNGALITEGKTMNDYGAIMTGHAYGILEQVFNAEWINLDGKAQQKVAADFLDAANAADMGAREYQRCIGTGNLANYAKCLK